MCGFSTECITRQYKSENYSHTVSFILPNWLRAESRLDWFHFCLTSGAYIATCFASIIPSCVFNGSFWESSSMLLVRQSLLALLKNTKVCLHVPLWTQPLAVIVKSYLWFNASNRCGVLVLPQSQDPLGTASVLSWPLISTRLRIHSCMSCFVCIVIHCFGEYNYSGNTEKNVVPHSRCIIPNMRFALLGNIDEFWIGFRYCPVASLK